MYFRGNRTSRLHFSDSHGAPSQIVLYREAGLGLGLVLGLGLGLGNSQWIKVSCPRPRNRDPL